MWRGTSPYQDPSASGCATRQPSRVKRPCDFSTITPPTQRPRLTIPTCSYPAQNGCGSCTLILSRIRPAPLVNHHAYNVCTLISEASPRTRMRAVSNRRSLPPRPMVRISNMRTKFDFGRIASPFTKSLTIGKSSPFTVS